MKDYCYEILTENEFEPVLNRFCLFADIQEANDFLNNLCPDSTYAESVDEVEVLILEKCFFGENSGSVKIREITRKYDVFGKLVVVSDKSF